MGTPFQELQEEIDEANDKLVKIAKDQILVDAEVKKLQDRQRELSNQFAMTYYRRENLLEKQRKA